METNGGWGPMSHKDPPAYGLVRSELPQGSLVLRAAPALWVLVFSHRRLGWLL